jgi:hypothetical protein
MASFYIFKQDRDSAFCALALSMKSIGGITELTLFRTG